MQQTNLDLNQTQGGVVTQIDLTGLGTPIPNSWWWHVGGNNLNYNFPEKSWKIVLISIISFKKLNL